MDVFVIQLFLSSSLEVGSCIAVQVCMLQIPLLILFNAFYVSETQRIFIPIIIWLFITFAAL